METTLSSESATALMPCRLHSKISLACVSVFLYEEIANLASGLCEDLQEVKLSQRHSLKSVFESTDTSEGSCPELTLVKSRGASTVLTVAGTTMPSDGSASTILLKRNPSWKRYEKINAPRNGFRSSGLLGVSAVLHSFCRLRFCLDHKCVQRGTFTA